MNNEVPAAMREEVQIFMKGHSSLEYNEDTLMELAMNCAARTSEIIINKLDLLKQKNYERSS